MKNTAWVAVILIFVAGLILWTKGNPMREIKTTIEINAPVELVWDTLIDVDDWAQWSPIIIQASGDAALGSTLSITMTGKEEGADGPQYRPVITIFDKRKTLRWRAKMLAEFVFTNDKVFELEATTTGTRLTHTELFGGMVVPLFWSSVEKNVPSMLESMNEALKRKVEANENRPR